MLAHAALESIHWPGREWPQKGSAQKVILGSLKRHLRVT